VAWRRAAEELLLALERLVLRPAFGLLLAHRLTLTLSIMRR
jgi:hypothetical protein